MANYEGWARTNYFRVKDEAAFRKELNGLDNLELSEDEDLFALLSTSDFGWDIQVKDDEGDWDEDATDGFSFTAWLASHLAEGEVAVGVQAGHEKLRCVSGNAWAVDCKGRVVEVRLWDIYDLAKRELFNNGEITEAEY